MTKYDPARRDANGAFQDDDWIMFADVERGEVSWKEYYDTETAYATAASLLLSDDGVPEVFESEDGDPSSSARAIPVERVAEAMRPMLRHEYGKLVSAGRAFVHVGYDFYMYVGVETFRDDTIRQIEKTGLFVEPFLSPYFPEESA